MFLCFFLICSLDTFSIYIGRVQILKLLFYNTVTCRTFLFTFSSCPVICQWVWSSVMPWIRLHQKEALIFGGSGVPWVKSVFLVVFCCCGFFCLFVFLKQDQLSNPSEAKINYLFLPSCKTQANLVILMLKQYPYLGSELANCMALSVFCGSLTGSAFMTFKGRKSGALTWCNLGPLPSLSRIEK